MQAGSPSDFNLPAMGIVTISGFVQVLTVRPKVAELVFQLYGRPLHPELFEVLCTRTVSRGDYEAKIDITSAGHVVTWRYGGTDAHRGGRFVPSSLGENGGCCPIRSRASGATASSAAAESATR